MRPSPSKASSAFALPRGGSSDSLAPHFLGPTYSRRKFRSRAAPVPFPFHFPSPASAHSPHFQVKNFPFFLVSVAAEAPPVRRGPGSMPRKWQVFGRPDGSVVWVPVSDAPPNPPPPGPLRPAPHHPPPPDDAPVGGSISINVHTPAFAFISIMDALLTSDLLSSAVRNPRPGRRRRTPHPLHGRPTPPR